MPKFIPGILLLSTSLFAQVAPSPVWNLQKAAAYLDQRADWWMNWPRAARDHETFCISCHTAVPYALSRPPCAAPWAAHFPLQFRRFGFALDVRCWPWLHLAT